MTSVLLRNIQELEQNAFFNSQIGTEKLSQQEQVSVIEQGYESMQNMKCIDDFSSDDQQQFDIEDDNSPGAVGVMILDDNDFPSKQKSLASLEPSLRKITEESEKHLHLRNNSEVSDNCEVPIEKPSPLINIPIRQTKSKTVYHTADQVISNY